MLKYNVTQEEFDALEDGAKALYKDLQLQVEGIPQPAKAKPVKVETTREYRSVKAELEAKTKELETARGAQGELGKLTEQVAKLTEQAQADARLANEMALEGMVRDAATAAGVVPTAIPDVISRVRSAGYQTTTDRRSATKEGGEPLSDYVAGLRESASHLFAAPKGSRSNEQTAANVITAPERINDLSIIAQNIEAIATGKKVIQ